MHIKIYIVGAHHLELERKIEKETDSICIYEFDSIKYSRKEQIGTVTATPTLSTKKVRQSKNPAIHGFTAPA
jgi:hypothetical protein